MTLQNKPGTMQMVLFMKPKVENITHCTLFGSLHFLTLMGTIGDGSIPMVSINTFGLIFIDVIDPSVKDFLFLIDSIDNQS
jgi:hypothetical protein